jgi:hypothetical protein
MIKKCNVHDIKIRHTGNCFSVRTIFRTKYTLSGTVMKTGPVRDAQQMKQCVHDIPCDYGSCYIGKSEYFGFPCQSSFHQLLHNHPHLSSGACTIGQKWPQYLVDVVPPHKKKKNYIGKTSRPSEICIKEHKYNRTPGLLEN